MTVEPVEVIHPHIECRPGVQGGRPVIKGTRFPVSSIVLNHRRGMTVDEMLCEFPDLSPAQVYDALSFYYDHRQSMDEQIATVQDVSHAESRYPATLKPSHGVD